MARVHIHVRVRECVRGRVNAVIVFVFMLVLANVFVTVFVNVIEFMLVFLNVFVNMCTNVVVFMFVFVNVFVNVSMLVFATVIGNVRGCVHARVRESDCERSWPCSGARHCRCIETKMPEDVQRPKMGPKMSPREARN